MDLEGHVVLITGATGGLGRGLARYFSEAGATVALHYRSDPAAAQELATEIGGLAVGGNIQDQAACNQIVQRVVAEFGRLDALINNAGIQPIHDLDGMSVAQWREVIDTNLTGTFLMTQAAAAEMDAGASIIHIASVEGSLPARGHAHYAASKAGVLMHARAAALEYGPRGIRVNTVSPGLIDTGGLADSWPEGYNSWNAAVPLGSVGSPEHIGAACAFLASPVSAWISGHDLVVDGGMSAVPAW